MPGKKRLHTEPEKVRQTTHWDMDYLPREAVDTYCFKTGSGDAGMVPPNLNRRAQGRLGLGLIAAGSALLLAAVAAGRWFSG